AQRLSGHPSFAPDPVHCAPMLSPRPAPLTTDHSLGVGELNAFGAALVRTPPNPNAGLDKFVGPDPTGGNVPVFDSVAWGDAAKSDVSWDSVAWDDTAWSSVAWDDVAWGDVAWGDVSWQDVAWGDVAWGDVAWGERS